MKTKPLPRISLCMIVKDEAELLPKCLAAAAGVWDELCIVDTGSNDDTVEIATAAGAKVIHRAWDDDFSAARNAGLEQATGDWVLVLDADELLSAVLVAQLRQVSVDPAVGAATVMVVNQLPHGHWRQSRLLRFFRRDGAIRFEHRIHEDASSAVVGTLMRQGRKLVHLEGKVQHLGYTLARSTARNKKARDLKLLSRSVREHPDNLYSWFKMLELARFWSDEDLWRRAAAAAAEVLERCPAPTLLRAHFGGEMVSLLSQGLYPSDPGRALSFINQWQARVGRSAALLLRRGELRELNADTAGARADFISCLSFAHALGDVQLATVRPLLGLARLALAEGNLQEAGHRTREALALNPADPEALMAAVALAGARGGTGAVVEFAADHVRANGETRGLHAALGEHALMSGQSERAVAELRLAAGNSPAGKPALWLAQALLAAGDVDGARNLGLHIATQVPEAALGVLLCDLLQGRASNLEVQLEPAAGEAALRAWVDVLRVHGCQAALGQLQAVAPVLHATFPWFESYVFAAVHSRLPLTG